MAEGRGQLEESGGLGCERKMKFVTSSPKAGTSHPEDVFCLFFTALLHFSQVYQAVLQVGLFL